MARDTSLDEFLGGESPGTDDADGEGGGTDEDAGSDAPTSEGAVADDVTEADAAGDASAAATDDEDAAGEDAPDGDAARSDPDADAIEPAAVTYDVTPDGAECAACGAMVTRRWRDEPGMVCGECKDW